MFSSRGDVWVYVSELSAYWMPGWALRVTPEAAGGGWTCINVRVSCQHLSMLPLSRGRQYQQAAVVVSVKCEWHKKYTVFPWISFPQKCSKCRRLFSSFCSLNETPVSFYRGGSLNSRPLRLHTLWPDVEKVCASQMPTSCLLSCAHHLNLNGTHIY